MTDAPATTPPTTPASLEELTSRLAEEVARLDRELGEVDLLVTQAKAEAARHESRRSAAADKLDRARPRTPQTDEVTELSVQLVTLTKRAALMESQVEVLEGKRGALARHRETMAAYAEMAAGLDPGAPASSSVPRRHRVRDPRRGRGGRHRGCSCRPRRTCAARSPGRCTTAPPRASPTSCSRPRSWSGSSARTRPSRRSRSASWSPWSSRRSRPPRPSSSTSGRWSSTTSGSSRRCVAPPASGASGPA